MAAPISVIRNGRLMLTVVNVVALMGRAGSARHCRQGRSLTRRQTAKIVLPIIVVTILYNEIAKFVDLYYICFIPKPLWFYVLDIASSGSNPYFW